MRQANGASGAGPGTRLRELIQGPGIVVVPGVFDGISALLARQAGFEVAYFSGGALANRMGIPDIGLFTLSELAGTVGQITAVVDMPLIVDVDTGFGGVVNVRRTVAEMRRLDVAAIHIEDQVTNKRCGHLDGKQLIPAVEMQAKIAAAREVAGDMVIVARTDSRAVEGLDGALARARAYVEAGADVIFPEALLTREEFAEFRARLPATPLLANMTEFGKTPYLAAGEFDELGYEVVIFPQSVFRLALGAMRDGYRQLYESGSQAGFVESMLSREAIYELIGYRALLDTDAAIARRFIGGDDQQEDRTDV